MQIEVSDQCLPIWEKNIQRVNPHYLPGSACTLDALNELRALQPVHHSGKADQAVYYSTPFSYCRVTVDKIGKRALDRCECSYRLHKSPRCIWPAKKRGAAINTGKTTAA